VRHAEDHASRGVACSPFGYGEEIECTAFLPGDVTSVRAARDLVSDALESWGARVDLDAVLLATSELVTNAVIHAGGVESITVRLTPAVARVEVADPDSGVPVLRDAEADAEPGRGLRTVAALTNRWGVDTNPAGGKVVWFTVPANGHQPSSWPLRY
jgi:anti-sigma regulatory factor (Ser/Thr protein kinase)